MNRAQLPIEIVEERLIAVLRGLETNRVELVVDILRDSGVGVVEVTMESPNADASIRSAVNAGAVVGAGTVMSIADAEAAVDAGAIFLVAPHTDLEVVEWAVDRSVPIVPGCFTPTEVATAWKAGASAIKIFPASVGGPGLLSSVRGPFGDLPLIPTGGVTAANAAAFLASGAVAVGVGGWLTNHDDPDVIGVRAAAIVEICRPR